MIIITYIHILFLVFLTVGQAVITLFGYEQVEAEAQMVRPVEKRAVAPCARAPNIW
jgi:hypothetical protein